MDSVNDILVRILFKEEGSKKLAKANQRLVEWQQDLNNKLHKSQQAFAKQSEKVKKNKETLISNTKQLRQVGKQFDTFGKVMGMPLEQWKQFNKAGGKFRQKGAKTANTIRKITHGFRGFRMEMLSVMFFGMGMQKFFSGLLKPAMESAGIFQLWSTILRILFLPIALAMLPIILNILDAVSGWSDKFKLMIGKFVIFGIVAGLALFLIGSLVLGIGGLILVFGGLSNIIDRMVPDISIFGVSISAVL